MAESVSVTHGGVTMTTNTASEAALRTEMEAPAAGSDTSGPSIAVNSRPQSSTEAAAPVRDEKGRFVKTEPATPPAEAPPPLDATEEPEPPARRREDPHPRSDLDARIGKVMAQKAAAERRAAALEAELQRVRPSGVTSPVTPPVQAPQAPTGPAEPQFEQFADQPDPYTAYLQAWTRWDRAQGLAQARAEWEAAQTEKARAQTFQQRLTEGRTRFPDYDRVLTEADTLGLQVSAVMQEAIADSPHAADLVYFLATHPEECTQLAEESQQTPVAAAAVMRRLLETRLDNRPAAPVAASGSGPGATARGAVSTAKPPVTPVGSSPVVSDEPPGEHASAAEHARYWNRRLKVPGTR